ncbi:MAG: TolC family protein [Kiritimatiellia bacterium]
MHFRLIYLLVLVATALRADEAPLTLNRAYELTLARSETLQIGEAEWRAAEARYRRAVAGAWPELRAEGSADFREGVKRSGEVFGAGFGATWTLFDGFQAEKAGQARRSEGEAVKFENERTRQLLYGDVAAAFFETLAREGEVDALGDQKAAIAARVAELQRRLELGRSRKAELLSAQAQLAELDTGIAETAALRDAARELLSFLTGLDTFTLAQPGPLPRAEEIAVVLADPENRPDLLAAARRARAAAHEVEVKEADRGVSLSADANVYLWRDPSDEDSWDIGLRAELPLFDRGARRAAVAERREILRVSELRLAELRRITGRDVRLALLDARAGLAQWVALREAIRVTEESWRQQQQDYEMGRASNLDVMTALIQLHTCGSAGRSWRCRCAPGWCGCR